MGGFTIIKLRDRSEENIKKHNELLKLYKVARKYRFYSEQDALDEYEWFKKGEGNWPEHLFPKDKIRSYKDFRKYWSPEALGECFVPPNGSLTFDCYFGRTSENAMRNIGRYIVAYRDEIASADGSFSTFMERGMTRLQREIIKESGIYE